MLKRFLITLLFVLAFALTARADWFSETWPSVRQRIERLTPKDHRADPVVLECSSSDEPVSPVIDLSADVALKLSYPDERYLRACDPPEAPRYSIYYREGEIIVYSVYESQRSAVSGQQLEEIGQLTADGQPLTADGQQSAASGQQSAEENRLTDDSQPLTVLKEWIYTEEPNMPEGSRYSWNILGAENVAQDDQGRVHVIAEEASYTIDPVIYWTKDDVQHAANWKVTTPTPGVEVAIHAKTDDYPLLIDPTVNYGQWMGADVGGSPTVITSMVYEDINSEIYVGGFAVPAEPFGETITMSGSVGDDTEGFVIEIGDGGTPTLVWGQWLGGTGPDEINAVTVLDDEIFAGGYSAQSTGFEAVPSFQGVHSGSSEGFVVEIADGGTPSLIWGQWLGGSGIDEVTALAVTADELYVAGYSLQSTSFEAITFQGANGGGSEGFLVEIDHSGGAPVIEWGQWVGGVSADEIYAVALTGDEIYVGGYSGQSTSFEAVTFQGAHSGGNEGFVVEIGDGGTPTLVWGQWLGGTGTDIIYALALTDDEIYAGGYATISTSFEAVTFQGTHDGGSEGFVVEIGDGGTPALAWGQWLGGTGNDVIYSLTVLADEVYAGGVSSSSTSFENMPVVGVHTGGSEGFFVEIADGGTPSLAFQQWIGGDGNDAVYAVEVSGDFIYAAGYSAVSSNIEDLTFQGVHNGGSEGFVALISDGVAPFYNWGQWVGGTGGSPVVIRAMASDNANDEIYTAGYAGPEGTWDVSVATYGAFHGDSEGFVVEIGDGGTPSLNWLQWIGGNDIDQVLALAVTGDEIYAGGYSVQSTGFETVTFSGAHNGLSEGFVVEIGDGGSPTLVWGQWLGGNQSDAVFALAVTDDEIYAAGFSDRSTSWESSASNQGTFVGQEGFVVEIADGGTPSLVWKQLIGGVNVDVITALAVEGDEVYVGGYTNQSTSFEAVTFAGVINNSVAGSEGFVIEIGDGGTPTLVWGQWLGGTNNDQVLALAVTGDEIYAAGYSASSISLFDETVTFQGAISGTAEGFVVEISDGGTPALAWGQWIGGSNSDVIYALALSGDELYAGGYSTQSTSFEAVTFQGLHSSSSEGFVVEIGDGGTPTLVWGQWLGGTGVDTVYGIAMTGDELYAGGYATISTSFEAVTFQSALQGVSEGFVIEIGDGGTPTLAWGQWFGGGQNPVNVINAIALEGTEIYAGGYATQSASFDGATFQGTFNPGDTEAFVVEVATGATPSLAWGQWLGGDLVDVVTSVAATGDEIYAAGYSTLSTGFEAVLTGAHSGGSEGFVIEIGDGGTPTIVWGQWIGGSGNEQALALDVTGDEVYVGGYSTQSTSIEAAGVVAGAHSGSNEGFVIEVADGGTPTLAWLQWLGGTGLDVVQALAVLDDEIYAGGYSSSSAAGFSEAVTFQGTYNSSVGISEGFVVEIGDGGTPALVWGQWLGGNSNDVVYALAVTGDEIYAAGYSALSTGIEAVTFYGAHSGNNEGFVVEIGDGGTPTLVWGYWLGGGSSDIVYSLSTYSEEIYAGGFSAGGISELADFIKGAYTASNEGFVAQLTDDATPGFTLLNWLGGTGSDVVFSVQSASGVIYAGGYAQRSTTFETMTFSGTHASITEGFVVEITIPTIALSWGQFVGGGPFISNDRINALAISGDEIYAGGVSDRSTNYEAVTFQGSHADSEGFVIEIADGGTPSLIWGQWLGGNLVDEVTALAVAGDEIYAAGYSTRSTSFDTVTFEGVHSGGTEGFVVEIGDGGTPTLAWGQWLGGSGAEYIAGLAVTDDEIYAAGYSTSTSTGTFETVTFQGTFGGSVAINEGFVIEIGDGGTPTLAWGHWIGGDSNDQVLALGIATDEIYVGGYSVLSTGFETVTFQGAHSGSSEGFVIEVADGGTPYLVWGQWLGGGSADVVRSLAVSGDEIYAAGYSTQSTSFEAVTFQGVHSGGSEGFVIEIMDGGTPSLSWGQWVGGNQDDEILSVAVVNSEIYAGGYSLRSTSFEAFSFTGTHSGLSEGFLVEIRDGASVPTATWGQWFGGDQDDRVLAVVALGDEVYAAGYSVQSTFFEAITFAGTFSGGTEGFLIEVADDVSAGSTTDTIFYDQMF